MCKRFLDSPGLALAELDWCEPWMAAMSQEPKEKEQSLDACRGGGVAACFGRDHGGLFRLMLHYVREGLVDYLKLKVSPILVQQVVGVLLSLNRESEPNQQTMRHVARNAVIFLEAQLCSRGSPGLRKTGWLVHLRPWSMSRMPRGGPIQWAWWRRCQLH